MTAESYNCLSRPISQNMQFLKSSNRATVLRALALKKASNRTELASYTNLTRMAISNIVNELIKESYVKEIMSCADAKSRNGRKPRQLALTDWKINSICLYIHRYSVACMLMDINGNQKEYSNHPLPETSDNSFLKKVIISSVQNILDKYPSLPIMGIGISSIGPLDIYKKYILYPPDFYNIGNLNIGELLEEKFHLPVFLDNDMNCSSLAELFFGQGKTHRDFVFLGFSSGVGAGIIMNERIIHGFAGFAGEVGHISVNPNGPLCPCGQKGCIELYTSGGNILRNTGTKTFDELNRILDSKEPPLYILKCIREYTDVMKTLLVAIANTYDPDIVILGDIDITFISRFIAELETHMNTFMLNHGYKHISIVPSILAASAPLYGAGSIVFQRIFDGEIPLAEQQ